MAYVLNLEDSSVRGDGWGGDVIVWSTGTWLCFQQYAGCNDNNSRTTYPAYQPSPASKISIKFLMTPLCWPWPGWKSKISSPCSSFYQCALICYCKAVVAQSSCHLHSSLTLSWHCCCYVPMHPNKDPLLCWSIEYEFAVYDYGCRDCYYNNGYRMAMDTDAIITERGEFGLFGWPRGGDNNQTSTYYTCLLSSMVRTST